MKAPKAPRHVGLARALSKLGFCSRSRAAQLIRSSRVTLNGVVKRSPEAPVRLDRDRIEVDGQLVQAQEFVYLAMNKPRGIVTSAADEKGRETVYSLLEGKHYGWLAPVGRLDKASEGLLLLTNDSEWSARLASPQSHLDKTYHVQIDELASAGLIASMTRGVREKGELLRAKSVRLLRSGEKNCWLEIVLDEGRNRHIRRMLAAHGIEVLRLVRVAIGPLHLGELAKGANRPLTKEENHALDRALDAQATRSGRARNETVPA